jgi:catechol 2,3-dioxygenase-like lactoylglutathione lyase family enzyme
MTSSVRHVTVDCADAHALATFWAAALGGRLADDDFPGDPEALVRHAGTPLLFVTVPEPKAVKNRIHLDLQPRTTREQEVERLLALGATMVADRTTPDGRGWVVLADPEGNELCVERAGPEPVDTGEREMPPLHADPERQMLESMLDWYREGVLLKVDGMDQADATTTPLRSGTTVAGLVKHLALVEDSWFTHGLHQQPEPEPWASAPFHDDRDWEFHSAEHEPLEASVALYEQACARSRAVAAAHDLDDTAVNRRGQVFSLRFVLLHLVEETARHLGHLDVLRELADGRTGE